VRKQLLFVVRTVNAEEREEGGSERHYGWEEQNLSSVLKVPRH
jgi:hypothetical protein